MTAHLRTSSDASSRLKQVEPDEIVEIYDHADAEKGAPTIDGAATQMLVFALKALGQKTIVAIGNLYALATLLSTFFLFYIVLPNPSGNQLVGLGLYAAFVLTLNWVRGK